MADEPVLGADDTDVADVDETATDAVADDAVADDKPADDVADKAAEDGEGEDGEDGDGDDKDSGAPDEYEPWKMPEGIELDESKASEFAPLAKKHNLSQEAAQEFVDLYAKSIETATNANAEAWANVQDEWVKAGKADKEYGGDKYDESVATANAAVREFGTPELVEALKVTGAGNHPEFIRFCKRVGDSIKSDAIEKGGPGARSKDHAEILYGDSAT